MTDSASTELAIIDHIPNPALVFVPQGLDPLLERIEKEARSQLQDISTEEGRDNIRSLAFKIAKSKTGLHKMGLALGEEYREKIKAINAERDRATERLETLQQEIRKPLTDWENADKVRVAAHEGAIKSMTDLNVWLTTPRSDEVAGRLALLPGLYARDWQEFSARALQTRDDVQAALQALLAEREKAEKDAAELERLRAEELVRQQKERDDQIAAAAAAQAKKDAEEEAERQRQVESARVEQERQDAAERERVLQEERDAAAAAGQKAEANRIAGHRQAITAIENMGFFEKTPTAAEIQARIDILTKTDERDWQEFLEEAVDTRTKVLDALTDSHKITADAEAAAAAEAQRLADERAAHDLEQAAAAAAQAERDRIAAEEETERQATQTREADKRHKAKINNAAVAAIIKALTTDQTTLGQSAALEQQAKAVVVAIASGLVPNVKINY